jgi:RNA polymerase sigma-70 factor (ECF subfamily)
VDKQAFARACREGGKAVEEALRSLDRSYFALLYRDCLRTVRDKESAHDLVQETFIKVWQRCATFHGDSELLPWIRTILRHTVLDRLRRQEQEMPLEQDGAMTQEVARGVAALSAKRLTPPDHELRRKQLADCFARCWSRFERASPQHAAVIAWIAEDGLGNEEIARLLGRTPGATREFVSQCRKRARAHLAEWYELAFGARTQG